jgi:large subunit ribosomal protein L22
MEVTAKTKYVRISPRKLRTIREIILGKDIDTASQLLSGLSKRGARVLGKTLDSAVANARQKKDTGIMTVKNILIDQGPVMKRFRAASMGRAVGVKKRSSHVTVVVEVSETAKIKKEEKPEIKKAKKTKMSKGK